MWLSGRTLTWHLRGPELEAHHSSKEQKRQRPMLAAARNIPGSQDPTPAQGSPRPCTAPLGPGGQAGWWVICTQGPRLTACTQRSLIVRGWNFSVGSRGLLSGEGRRPWQWAGAGLCARMEAAHTHCLCLARSWSRGPSVCRGHHSHFVPRKKK